jgi:hypothetical protein
MFWLPFDPTFFESFRTGREVYKATGWHGGDDEEHEDPEDDYVIFDTPSLRFGSLSARSECVLQNRAAFLNGKSSYLLYF